MYAYLKEYTLYDCIKWFLHLPNIVYILPEAVKVCHAPWKFYGEFEVINIVTCISITNIIC